eukprot:TRINITY_DN109615_c0_g1_i1.p1 TRINITY_DN109615_c0_g1~~TRINITY_DN109615_c0_g1_i1.p1  ORF type:complete len:324 (+),score=46.24 TRINITY_DN109615_c0_g1_i1:81-974(+)
MAARQCFKYFTNSFHLVCTRRAAIRRQQLLSARPLSLCQLQGDLDRAGIAVRCFSASSENKSKDYDAESLSKISLKQLRELAVERSVDISGCFEKADVVKKLFESIQNDSGGSSSVRSKTSTTDHNKSSTVQDSRSDIEVKSMGMKELRALIHKAGLQTDDLFEKPDFINRALQAKEILKTQTKRAPKEASSSPKKAEANKDSSNSFADADRYRYLDVVLYFRGECPHCTDALKLLQSRGLRNFPLEDVGWSKSAAIEMRKRGGQGVPFFYSRRSGKSLSGWKSGATDLHWLLRALG